jgi:NAD(P)-dependent dehydrogenase (short-subunit alcohol dehydrogenase family)
MHGSFKNHCVIISGALGDIGRSIVKAFVLKGANVALGDVKQIDEAQAFLASLNLLNPEVKVLYDTVDVRDPSQVKQWVDRATNELGSLDIIVPNAATVTIKGIMEIRPQEWANELKVNLDGAFYLSRFASEKLLQEKVSGRLVFVGSWAAEAVHQNLPTYSVSKAGLRMLSKCMALELAPNDILVNEIAPGYVDAGLSKQVLDGDASAKLKATEKVPVKRIMHPDEVASSVLWLCDFENKHMTGSTLLMDGGLSLLS